VRLLVQWGLVVSHWAQWRQQAWIGNDYWVQERLQAWLNSDF
jgi:hypothetical protein